jgi:hypothetical protein
MKKMILAVLCVFASMTILARPHFRPAPPPPPRHGPFRPMPPPLHRYHHSHYAPGFWPGLIGGTLIWTAISSRPSVVVTPAPAVVVQATTTQQVWVEGRYVDVIAPNGTVVRQWQPGHWEMVTVPVR